jgi:acyl-CoA thioester hydrolase
VKPNQYHYTYRIKAADLDALNHVNNLRFAALVLEAAQNHWEHLAPQKLQSEFAWFLVEHHIKYKAQGFLNDELKITTWVKATSTMKSVRIVEIYRDRTCLVTSETTWCLVTQDQKSLTPIPTAIKDMFER